MKKINTKILFALMLCMTCAFVVFAKPATTFASDFDVWVEVSPTPAHRGDTVTATVHMKGNNGIRVWDLTLKFPEFVTSEPILQEGVFSDITSTWNQEELELNIKWGERDLHPFDDSNGIIAALTFQIPAAGVQNGNYPLGIKLNFAQLVDEIWGAWERQPADLQIVSSENDFRIWAEIDKEEAKPGEDVTVTYNLSGNVGLLAMHFASDYPYWLETEPDIENGVLSGVQLSWSSYGSPNLVFIYNEAENVYTNGVLATVTFKVPDDAPNGVYPISLETVTAVDAEFVAYYDNAVLPSVNLKIADSIDSSEPRITAISEPPRRDVSADGATNVQFVFGITGINLLPDDVDGVDDRNFEIHSLPDWITVVSRIFSVDSETEGTFTVTVNVSANTTGENREGYFFLTNTQFNKAAAALVSQYGGDDVEPTITEITVPRVVEIPAEGTTFANEETHLVFRITGTNLSGITAANFSVTRGGFGNSPWIQTGTPYFVVVSETRATLFVPLEVQRNEAGARFTTYTLTSTINEITCTATVRQEAHGDAPDCPTCGETACDCTPLSGIDYETVIENEIKIPAVTFRFADVIGNQWGIIPDGAEENENIFINLTREKIIIPAGFTIAAYSVNGGKTWKAGALSDAAFAKLLAKDLDLWLCYKDFNSKSKKPQGSGDEHNIIAFKKINKRAPRPAEIVNYLIGANENDGDGDFVLSARNDPATAIKNNIEIGLAAANRKTVDEKHFGAFFPGETNGVPLSEMDGAKVVRDFYFIRTAPSDKDGVYTAASKPRRIAVRGLGKPTKHKINYANETIKLKKGDAYRIGDNGEFTLVDESKGIVLDDVVSEAITNFEPIEIKKAATVRRPATTIHRIRTTIFERAELDTNGATVSAAGKLSLDKKFEVFNATTKKWGGLPKMATLSAGENILDIRVKSTAKITKNGETGNAASIIGTLTITCEMQNNKLVVTAAVIAP
ncbi:MAG: cohesin domain-containing protein [Defluviitaleaceae bacterium]|nr:cohesin domain-containing protein [Defluviitaleaceae bacterium]